MLVLVVLVLAHLVMVLVVVVVVLVLVLLAPLRLAPLTCLRGRHTNADAKLALPHSREPCPSLRPGSWPSGILSTWLDNWA